MLVPHQDQRIELQMFVLRSRYNLKNKGSGIFMLNHIQQTSIRGSFRLLMELVPECAEIPISSTPFWFREFWAPVSKTQEVPE
ncbi:MAG: hypothetical protein CMN04_00655 [Roseibacillus sp.]|nr:hypothetical protein [Roseibacillus sp.]